jgi:hypothetical protein
VTVVASRQPPVSPCGVEVPGYPPLWLLQSEALAQTVRHNGANR